MPSDPTPERLERLERALESIQGECYLWQQADGPYEEPADLIEYLRKEARAALADLPQPDLDEAPTIQESEPEVGTVADLPPDSEREQGERCQSCGRRYETVWAATNSLWNAVIGNRAGLRCPECFDREAREAGFSPYWACADGHLLIAENHTAPSLPPEAKEGHDG